ncbi:MAG: hypothetical protein J6T10_32035 [Methanobrevibacter sp.]|nr:hypothetical protein [Methanobrevibacter sp.]
MTKIEIMEYAKNHSNREAADMLLLLGSEFFLGTLDEYNELMDMLEVE